MKKIHTVLLIEDDLVTAEAMTDALETCGFGVVHTTNAEEAQPLIAKGEFCLVILDMQIKAKPSSPEALISVGQGVLAFIRERFPGQTPRRKFLMPVLVNSLHDEFDLVKRTLKSEASDYLSKRLDPQGKDLQDALSNALRDSDRERHVNCLDATANARRAAGSESRDARTRISIRGYAKGRATGIDVDGRRVDLPNGSLYALLVLFISRDLEKEDWLNSKEHGADETGWKAATRLRADLAEVTGLDGRELVQNDYNGGYRLGDCVDVMSVDWPRLARHPYPHVRKLAEIHA